MLTPEEINRIYKKFDIGKNDCTCSDCLEMFDVIDQAKQLAEIKSMIKTGEELEERFNQVYPPELTEGLPNVNACRLGFKEGYLACLKDIQNELQ